MEEKILIQSVHYNFKKAIAIFSIVIFILIGIATAIAYSVDYNFFKEEYTYGEYYSDDDREPLEDDSTSGLPRCEHTGEEEYKGTHYSYYSHSYYSNYEWEYYDGVTYADFKEDHPTVGSYVKCIDGSLGDEAGIVFLIGLGGWLVIFVILLIINSAISKYSLTVTNMRVYGVTIHKKRVDLPIDSVSAFSTSSHKGISIGTSSGRIRFNLIKNRDDVAKVLSDLIVERQSRRAEYAPPYNAPYSAPYNASYNATYATPAAAPVATEAAPATNDVDELRKYKSLLDEGIISQEEFDEKKKQLLGL